MFLKRNLLESTTIISCAIIIICVLLNYLTNISPITGIWFPLYLLTLFFASLHISIKFIQWLLRLNKPIKYDFDGVIAEYPYLSCLSRFLPQIRKKSLNEYKEYDTNELSVISSVLERILVSSWYLPYISQEIGFPFACKQMLDQIIGKSFQICNNIETKDVYVDIGVIIISHLKEYKKALKRHEKSPSTSIESHYKKSHPIFDVTNKNFQPTDHCTDVLRVVFKELAPWELWDTPQAELLIRIMSKKLDNFINCTLADPAWLNDKLLTILKGKIDTSVNENNSTMPEVKTIDHKSNTIDTTNTINATIEPTLPSVITKSEPVLPCVVESAEPKPSPEKIEQIVEEVPVTSSEPVDIKSSPILRQRRGRQGRNEVKIYDRIIEGSIKTWETDVDLQCISLGQDLLASLDGEITLSRLWGQDAEPEGSPNPPRSKSPQLLWFGEEDTVDADLNESSPPREQKKEFSPKTTDALLKDIQSTVSQAKNKIGDLQVEPKLALHVNKQSSSDEAAGMMEGLLDFGIAGLKKGLRFTGLSDDSQDKSPSHHPYKPSDKSPPEVSHAAPRPKEIMEHKDAPVTTTQREDNSSAPPLLKQQRVISQDSVPSQPQLPKCEFPTPLMPLSDSPEPEYEEAADLSTSIAKLRCLLQQRAESSPRSEEVWWESAEETRGRIQQHHSLRPVDTATLADEYDMHMDRNSSPGQASNNMQRLDKLFQRTVTGVFNSLRTAVGAEEQPPPSPRRWTYVCSAADTSVGGSVARLLGARRGPQVDAALDSLDQLPAPRPAVEDSPDDFDEWCSVHGRAWTACSDLAAAAGLSRSHVAHRLVTLLVADLAESLMDTWLDDLSAWLQRQVFVFFEDMSEPDVALTNPDRKLPELNVEEISAALIQQAPALQYVFGEETVRNAARLTVSSFTHKEINRDVIHRALDVLAVHVRRSAGLRQSSFDAD